MKRTFFLFIFNCFIYLLSFPVYIDNISYALNESSNEATIDGSSYSIGKDLVIPGYITYDGKNYKVTKINNRAFQGKSMETIFIPNTITQVGYDTNSYDYSPFYDCTKIKKVVIQDGEDPITFGKSNSYGVFNNNLSTKCSKIEYIYIGRNVKGKIGLDSNGTMGSIKTAVIGPKVSALPNSILDYQRYLENVYFYGSEPPTLGQSSFDSRNYTCIFWVPNQSKYKYQSAFNEYENKLKSLYWDTNAIFLLGENHTASVMAHFDPAYEKENISIPPSFVSDYDTYTVISVQEDGFSNKLYLKEITLPESIQAIQQKAFYNCSNLQEVIIPSATVTIGSYAFYGTSTLKTVYIQPSSDMLTIETYAFASSGVEKLFLGRDISAPTGLSTSLKQVELDFKVTTLPDNAFSGCTNLTEVIMPNPNFGVANLTTIGQNAFLNCRSLPSISLPRTVQTLGDAVFKGCSSLQSIELSPQIYTIPKEAFMGCSALNNITLPNGVTAIGDYAFANCSNLPTINIPEGVTVIQGYTFQNCIQLDNITLPGKLVDIINFAFDGCKSLSQITLPNSMNAFGRYAFRNCASLQSVKFSEKFTKIPGYAFQNCTALTGIVLPEKVTTIENNAFDGCTSLTIAETSPVLSTIGAAAFQNCNLSGISLPATVTSIGASAFDGNSNLTEVYSFNTTPPTCASANSFSALTKANAKLYIPGTSLNSYRTSVCWKEFQQSNMYPLVAVTSINVEAPANRLRINKTMELTATVAPDNTTFTDVIWNSSNPNVATISDDGTVSALSPGYTIITAKSKSLFAVEGIFELQVIDFLLGDSNESDDVTITDAVNIASYVMDKIPPVFNFEASDVNESGDITLADASGVISIVLNDTENVSENGMRKAPAAYGDRLMAPDFNINFGDTAYVPVNLQTSISFIAMQADVKAKGGLKIEDVKESEAISASHFMMTKRIADDAVRVVIYSPALNVMPAEAASLFDVVVSGNPGEGASLEITNILATDIDFNEYCLGFEGGNCTASTTGVGYLDSSRFSIEANAGMITVTGAEGAAIRIFAPNGSLAVFRQSAGETETFDIVPGVYIVTVDDKAHKVIVR